MESTPLGWLAGWLVGYLASKKKVYHHRSTETDNERTDVAGTEIVAADDLKLSGQVRSMSRSRALVRHDICFLFRRTYAPRRIYMSHWNRTVEGGNLFSSRLARFLLLLPPAWILGQVLGSGRG